MVLAGFAAVGEILGQEAEEWNRNSDVHEVATSDLWRALTCADALVGTDPDTVTEFLSGRESAVRASFRSPPVRNAVKHVAAVLFDYGNVSGPHVRGIIKMHANDVGDSSG